MTKTRKQYGVIPFIRRGKKYRLVLVTSQTHGYWIFPKGHLVPGKSKYESAAQEAFEEAGLKGTVHKDHVYEAHFSRKDEKTILFLYPMEVKKMMHRWPERHQRKRRAVRLSSAEELLEFKELRKCARKWADDFC